MVNKKHQDTAPIELEFLLLKGEKLNQLSSVFLKNILLQNIRKWLENLFFYFLENIWSVNSSTYE